VNSEQKFLKRLDSIINRRTTFGKLEESLNIQSAVTLSPVERQYNQRLEEARKQIKELDKELQTKIKNLTARGATAADVARITEPIERALRRARIEYQGLVSSYDQVQEAARNEQRLFGVGSAATGRTRIFPVLALVGGIYYLTR
jgi:3'-phosphoadenosine 5'-phosphosulfate sulfotransferase (PAPS reductase)/FAD synthetase